MIGYIASRKNADDGIEVKSTENAVGPVPPLLTVIEQLSPIETDRLLQMFMQFVVENPDLLVGMASLWIYALFLRLEKPFRAKTTANMRNFCRFCIKQRDEVKEDVASGLIVVTNMFIVIIEDVFKQPVT